MNHLHPERRRARLIERYSRGERTNHWLVAITFVLLALSGLAMFHPAMYWLSNLFGGGTWNRILHPFVGVFMFLVFLVYAGRMWRHNLMDSRDWEWLKRGRDVVNNREGRVPEVGRFNGGQKLVYFVFVVCMIGLLLSGIVIWRQYFAFYFPIGVIRAASVIHAICALVMICAIIVHIYAGIWVKGSLRAMMRGTVSWGWAWKHHRAWFRQVRKEPLGK